MKNTSLHIGLIFCLLLCSFVEIQAQIDTEELYQSGRSEFNKGNIQEAITIYQQAGEIALADQDYEQYVKTLTAIGKCYNSIGFQKELTQAIEVAKNTIKDHPGSVSHCLQGRLANLSAIMYNHQNRDSLVLESYYEAEKHLIGCKEGYETDLAGVWINIGLLYYKNGLFDQSEPFYQKGLHALIDMRKPNHPFAATAYHNLSRQYRVMMETEIALEYLHKSIDIRRQVYSEDHPYLAASYQTLGFIYQQLHQYKQAERYFHKALQVYENLNVKNSLVEISARASYGYSLSFLGKYDEAETIVLETIRQLDAKFPEKKPRIAVINNYMAKIFVQQDRFIPALPFAERARKIQIEVSSTNQENLKITESLLTQIYLQLGHTHKAEKIFDQTIEELWPANGDLSVIPAKQYLLRALYSKADRLFHRGEYKTAEEMIEKGIQVFEILITNAKTIEDKSFFLETTNVLLKLGMKVEHKLFEETKDPKHFEQAFHIAELHKSHLLTEFLNNQKAISFAGIPKPLIEKEEETRTYLAYYKLKAKQSDQASQPQKSLRFRIKAAELQHTHDSLLSTISSKYPRYAQLRLGKSIIDVEEVRKKLIKPGTSLIEYFWDGNTFFSLTIEKDALHFIEIDQPSLIREDLEEYLTLISDRYILENRAYSAQVIREIDQVGNRLFEKLLGHAVSSSTRELIIIPDGALGYLPFDNLTRQPKNSARSYRELEYLWKNTIIYYGFSANLLAGDLAQVNKKNKGFAGFAPGEIRSDTLAEREVIDQYLTHVAPLKYNQVEVENIGKIWGGKIFKGKEASESIFREEAPGKGILHLAMHALINDSLPAFSGLLFQDIKKPSQGVFQNRNAPKSDSVNLPANNDGLLTAAEIYGLDLNADLVVLSACNTGLGRHQTGEGVMSLARAFAYAGCPNIVMTLWQADDQATSLLMKYFYTYMKEGYSKSESLQKAKHTFLENHDQTHPYYWGSFVIIGDPSPVNSSSNWPFYLLIGVILFLGLFIIYRYLY